MNETISLLSGQMSGITSSIAATEARTVSAFEVRLAEIVAKLDSQAKELTLAVTNLAPRLEAMEEEAKAAKDRTSKSSNGLSLVALALSSSAIALEALRLFLHGSIL